MTDPTGLDLDQSNYAPVAEHANSFFDIDHTWHHKLGLTVMTVMCLTVKPITEKGEVDKTLQSQRNGKIKK